MQKRVSNVIRSLAESENNPVVSIHDHGAGGHLNCLSELVETTGGKIDMSKLPIGDPTLSAKEIIGNESQERMGLLLENKDIERVKRIAERERSPMYVVGETTGDGQLVFEQTDGQKPLNMQLSDFFGKPPRTVIKGLSIEEQFKKVDYTTDRLNEYVEIVLQLEAVACKDWLTNKVDRSVTGKVARQQCQGEIQLPLSDLGAVALDYRGKTGIATSIGHAPQAGLIDPAAGSILSVAEALTNIVFAPLKDKIAGVSLSANWMWPCKNPGEDARLYDAVKACSDFACDLGINIPTGKDSLSMTQKYGEEKVYAPGTVIISAAAEVTDIRKIVSPVLVNSQRSTLYYIDFSFDTFKLGGSAFAQSQNRLGDKAPTVRDAEYFVTAFNTVQELIEKELIISSHDISAGGMIVTLLEMNFGNETGGVEINLDKLAEKDLIKILFSENSGIIIQVEDKVLVEEILVKNGIAFAKIGKPVAERHILVSKDNVSYHFGIDFMRDVWYSSSYLLDRLQSGEKWAKERFLNYKQQPVQFRFNKNFNGTLAEYGLTFDRKGASGIRAAIVREKGTNGDREMAYCLYLAGFDVKDVHTTDLVSGRETLEDINFLVFCGGFANSDVLGSAKGWAGTFLYNEKAKQALDKFYARTDTLSLGICNGCQLMIELNLVTPKHKVHPQMLHNDSKYESAFLTLTIPKNKSVMLSSLAGNKLGVWVAHGEGKFRLPLAEKKYVVAAKYNYDAYPGNPNGSDYSVAGICSRDGRHLALMPHPERALFPWQCASYPNQRKNDEVTPWIEAFVNARKWIEEKTKS